jgi:hypothetical protein
LLHPPNEGIWSFAYCNIINRIENTNKDTRFPTLSAHEKHVVDKHKDLTFDPEPKDLDKFEAYLEKDILTNQQPNAGSRWRIRSSLDVAECR